MEGGSHLVVFHVRTRCAISTVTEVPMMPLKLIAIIVVDGNAHETGSRLTQRRHLDSRVLIIDEDPFGDEGILAAENGGDTFHQYLPELINGCCGELGLQLKELLGSIALNG